MDEVSFLVILEDKVEKIIDEFGHPTKIDSSELLGESHALVDNMVKVLGNCETDISTIVRSRDSNFGGYDVITQTENIIFCLIGSISFTKVLPYFKEWLSLKKSRKVKIKKKEGEVSIEITGYNAHEIEEIIKGLNDK